MADTRIVEALVVEAITEIERAPRVEALLVEVVAEIERAPRVNAIMVEVITPVTELGGGGSGGGSGAARLDLGLPPVSLHD